LRFDPRVSKTLGYPTSKPTNDNAGVAMERLLLLALTASLRRGVLSPLTDLNSRNRRSFRASVGTQLGHTERLHPGDMRQNRKKLNDDISLGVIDVRLSQQS
jgi:hypothetical protein